MPFLSKYSRIGCILLLLILKRIHLRAEVCSLIMKDIQIEPIFKKPLPVYAADPRIDFSAAYSLLDYAFPDGWLLMCTTCF